MRLFLISALAFVFGACGSESPDKAEVVDEIQNEVDSWEISDVEMESAFEAEEGYVDLDISELQAYCDTMVDLIPEEIMNQYYGHGDEEGEGNETMELQETMLEDGYTELVLINDNIADESIRARKVVMELRKNGDSWKVISIKQNWQCWSGRGHENWGVEDCL